MERVQSVFLSLRCRRMERCGSLTEVQWIATGYALAMTTHYFVSIRKYCGTPRQCHCEEQRDAAIHRVSKDSYGGCGAFSGSQWITTGISQCPRDDRLGFAQAPLVSFGPAPPRAKTPLAPPFFVALSVILPSMASLLLLLETNPEATGGVVEGARGVVAALGGTQARPVVVPGTTAVDPERARCRSSRIDYRVAGRIRRLIPVRRPFPDVPVHIIEAPRVRGKLSDIHGLIGVRPMIPVRIPGGDRRPP